MKIQCDVCNQKEAVVYCSADEAALCAACDQRVHHANKLAGKHPRFNLLQPQPKDSPVCDICQEKKALLFCQQDRALLCKDCDVAIHKVNQFTQNHCRFLLTGVKLSPTCSLYSSSTATTTTSTTTNASVTKNGVVPDQHKQLPSQILNQDLSNGSGNGSSTSSISEYLIETLPGWHVEDFLDPPSCFTKVVDNEDLGSIWGDDILNGSFNKSLSPESMGLWVPQASPPPPPEQPYTHVYPRFEPGSNMGFGDHTLSFAHSDYNNLNNKITKSSRKWRFDNGNCFTVPQISPSSTSSKRSRTLWH